MEVRISDICQIIGGGTPKTSVPEYWNGNIYWLSVKDFTGECKYVYDTEKKITQLGLDNSSTKLLKKGDIIISARGTVGEMAIIPYPMAFNQSCFGLRANDNVDNEYLYYLLKTKIKDLRKHANGAVFDTITTSTFNNIYCSLPPLPLQRRIAAILSSLDDKIACNQKICRNLEEQAQALFKDWFIDFTPFKNQPFIDTELGKIPMGWKVITLDEATSKFKTGLNPRQNFKLGSGNNYYVTIKNIINNRVVLDDKCDKVDDEALQKIQKRSKLLKGDLLFSSIGTIGRVAIVADEPTNWNTSESLFNMHPSKEFSTEFLYVLLVSKPLQDYVKINSQGAVQQGIRMASLKAYKFACPPKEDLQKIIKLITPLINSKNLLEGESSRLSALRDTLLPRLMSGEIAVLGGAEEVEK